MALTTSTITGRVPLPDDANPAAAEIVFTLSGYDTEGSQVIPGGAKARFVLVNGEMPAGAKLWRNTEGLRGTVYAVEVAWSEAGRRETIRRTASLGVVQVGDDASYTLGELLDATPVPVPDNTYWRSITQQQYDDMMQAKDDAEAAAVATAEDREAAEQAAAQAALYGPLTFPSAAAFFASSTPDASMIGKRAGTQDGLAWDIVAAGTGDFDHPVTGVGMQVISGPGGLDVRAFGATGDGVTDDTVAIQAAIDTGRVLLMPWGEYLITDSLEIDQTKGCTISCEARTVPNTAGFPRLVFDPPTKRDLFIWKSIPTSYAFAAVDIGGLAVRGQGAGAAAVFNLPRLYRGRLDAYIFSGIDHYAIVERWLDCKVTGNINGFRSSAFRLTNSTLAGNNITTRTDIDVYISGGDPGYTTYGYDIETYAIVDARLYGMVESVDCAVRMARGNTVDSFIYTENIPRTNAGALFEIGKVDAGAPDGTTIFRHHGANLHGRNVAAPGYSDTLFADIDHCSSFSISGSDMRRFGSLLKTTANSKNVALDNCYAIGVDLIEPTTSGIADFNELTFRSVRAVNMFSPHGNAIQSERVITTTQLSPQGLVRPRWAGDTLRSTGSNSLWTSIGDGLFDWRLSGQLISTGLATLTPPASIAAGASWQATVTTNGALVGDFALASCGALDAGLMMSARVTAADTVTITLTNVTGAPIATTGFSCRTMVTRAMV